MSFFTKSSLFKWLKRIVLTVVSVLSLSCLILMLLLGTQTGTQWLFAMAHSVSEKALLEEMFSYKTLQGNLFDTIYITDFEYHDSDVQLNVDKLVFSWKPQKLLQNIFYLEQLKLDVVRFRNKNHSRDEQGSDSSSGLDDDSKQEALLSDIKLPLNIIINKVELSDIHVLTNPDEPALKINALTIKADAKLSTVNISQIEIKTPEFELLSHGKLILKDHYPMEVQTELKINSNEIPPVLSKGVLKGDFKQLNLIQSLTGGLQGELDIRLHNPLSELTWNGTANVRQIPLRLLNKDIDIKEEVFHLSLKGEGNLDEIILKTLQLNLSEGKIVLAGKVNWDSDSNSGFSSGSSSGSSSGLNWDLILNTYNLNPSVIYPQWPGEINLKLEAKGKQKTPWNEFDEKNIELKLSLHHLKGTLHGQPLSGKGYFEMDNGFIQVQNVQLNSGTANININGTITQKLDLKWQMDIPELRHLLPELSGFLIGSGQLSGTQEFPILAGEINADKLQYDDFKLNKAKLDFSVSADEKHLSHLSLKSDNILFADTNIQNVALKIDGTGKTHNIGFKSNVMGSLIQLNAKGQYFDTENFWQGDVNQLNVNGKVPGVWQLKESSRLVIYPEKANLDKLCLINRKASVCTSAQWHPDNTQADIQATNIALDRIKAWLPDDINELTGEANLNASVSIQQMLKAVLNIELSPGHIAYLFDDHKQVRLKHQNGSIQAVLDEQELTTQWNLNIGEHGIKGNLKVPRPALESDLFEAPIKGDINLDIKELGLLTALVPEIRDAQGFIHADLQIGGIVSKPDVAGAVEFVSEKISIPLTGMELSKVKFSLKGNADKPIDIKGIIHSEKGMLNLNGELSLNAKKKWPVKLHLQGENFQIVNLPELQAIISPDIKLTHGIDGIKIKGLLDIPEAGIFFNELPEGSKTVSDDVVVVGEEAAKPANIDLDITVKLGKDIHLKAIGLNAWLNGQMRIKKSSGQLATANGELRTTHGTFRAYGQNLTIEQGRLFYAGGYLDNPGLNIRANKEVKDVTVGVMATGTAKVLDVSVFSNDPGLNSKDIVSLLLTGQKFDDADNARFYAGTDLSDELSVGVNAGVGDESSEFVVRYKLLKNMHVEGISSTQKSGGNLIYTIEIE